MEPVRTLDRGIMAHDGRRGVVVSYPGTADNFRRRLTRLAAESDAVGEPAAALLALAERLLSPSPARCRSESPGQAAARANS